MSLEQIESEWRAAAAADDRERAHRLAEWARAHGDALTQRVRELEARLHPPARWGLGAAIAIAERGGWTRSFFRTQIMVTRSLQMLEQYFVPDVRLTLIARLPGDDDADIVFTRDEVPELLQLLMRRCPPGGAA